MLSEGVFFSSCKLLKRQNGSRNLVWILCRRYTSERLLFNCLQPFMATWWFRERDGRERHYCYLVSILKFRPDALWRSNFCLDIISHNVRIQKVLSCYKVVFNVLFDCGRLRLKCDDTWAETILRLSAKRTSQFKSAGASVQSTTGSRGVRISDSNAGCTMFRGSVKSTGYPLHSPAFPPLLLPCVTVCHHISTGL